MGSALRDLAFRKPSAKIRKAPMMVDLPALLGPTRTLKSCKDIWKFSNAL
jgi:hypothetical protein